MAEATLTTNSLVRELREWLPQEQICTCWGPMSRAADEIERLHGLLRDAADTLECLGFEATARYREPLQPKAPHVHEWGDDGYCADCGMPRYFACKHGLTDPENCRACERERDGEVAPDETGESRG